MFFRTFILMLFTAMRIAIISDIHEDFEMLEKATQSIRKEGCDLLVCLGDITGYAKEFYHHRPDANACLDLIREISDHTIAGNHDLHVIEKLPSYHRKMDVPDNWYKLSMQERRAISKNGIWLYEEEIIPLLSGPNRQFLDKLPEFEVLRPARKGLMFSHFVQPDICGITSWMAQNTHALRNHFDFMEQSNVTYSFVGHTHPWGASIAGRLVWNDDFFSGNLTLSNRRQVVFCPPITGNKKKSGFLLYDTNTNALTQVWVT